MDGWTEFVRDGTAEYQTAIRSRRLRRLLREVWESLPVSDRLKINDNLILVSDASVLTTLLDDSGAEFEGLYGAAFRVWSGNRVVYLSAARMKGKGDAFTSYVIAHELAHVFHRHERGGKRAAQRHEAEADATAARWGYPDTDPLPVFTLKKGKRLPKSLRGKG